LAGNGKVLINLATGMEDGEKVLISLLVATAAQQQGKQVRIWATKDAVRLGLPDTLQGVVCNGCPAEKIPHTEIVGATPMWEWAGDNTTVFSY
jgi:hypothetical protein